MDSRLISTKTLTLSAALELANMARGIATEKGVAIHVTVVDAAGHVMTYQRMEGSPYPAREFSEKKAFTALSFKKPTLGWKERLAQNPHLAAGLSQHPKVAMIGGGEPVIMEDQPVGAIGIAGGLEEDDIIIAHLTLKNLGYTS